MADQSKIDVTVEVKWEDNGHDTAVLGATIVQIAVSGAVTVAATSYEWKGIATADQAEQVALLARWAFGRALSFQVGRPEQSVVGRQTANDWHTTVTWSPHIFPTITVILEGFTSLGDAPGRAREAVEAVVSQLVPARDEEERVNLCARIALPAGAHWAGSLLQNPKPYP